MIWVDREVKQLKKRKLPLEWVDDMKTPSGRIHVGALRGVVIHDLIFKALRQEGVKVKYTYVFDDHDPMDDMPSYLDFDKWSKYLGQPLYKIPSPKDNFSSFGEFYAQEFRQVFESINCHPEIIWTSNLYNSGKMNQVIRQVLDASDTIRKIYYKIAKSAKPDDWHPFNVVCENCGKVGTTYVHKWDGKYVYYRCQKDLVDWAQGCSYEGKISPFDGNGKISWKVEWAVKWKVIGVTVEGAGKDHMSAGGSHDVASAVCKQVLKYPVPYPLPYEWFTVGGAKMSSSKGVGVSAKEVAQILPPDLTRFLLVRTPIKTAIDFDPEGNTIPNLFDDYDRCLTAYFDKIEGNIEGGKEGEVKTDFARIAELSAISSLPDRRIFLPRFRTVVNLIKTEADLVDFFEKQKGEKLNDKEKEVLEERVVYAKVYLKDYADEQEKVELQEKVPTDLQFSKKEIKFLEELVKALSVKVKDKEEIQTVIFEAVKKANLTAKEAFPAFYKALIGKKFGPKAADLVIQFGQKEVINRLEEVVERYR